MVVRSDWAGGKNVAGNGRETSDYMPVPKPSSWNGGTIAPPSQRAPYADAPKYTPPPQDMVYVDPRITNPNDNWAQPLPYAGSGGGGGATGGTQSYVGPGDQSTNPVIAQGPTVGGRAWYDAMDAQGQQAEQNKYLGGDSDYQAQLGEYDRALKDFVSRISGQITNFNDDAKLATTATNQNMNTSKNELGADFGARGLSYSGMAAKSQEDLSNRFNDQVKNIDLVRGRNVSDAQGRQKDYESENQIGRGNAKRSALARMMANQQLVDSGTAF